MDEKGYTKREFAEVFGVSLHAVDKWVEAGIPRIPVGKNRWRYGRDAFKWSIGKIRANGKGKKRDVQEETAVVELQRAKLKLDKERAEVVPVSTFREVLADVTARLDSKVQAVPRKLAPDLLGIEELPKMVDALDLGVEELRAELRVALDD